LRRFNRGFRTLSVAAAIAGLVLGGTPAASATTVDDDPQTNIVGGHDPTQKYPFMVSFLHPKASGEVVSYCGGSLVAPDWVVSAGHCGAQFKVGVTQVRVGSSNWQSGGTVIGIGKIVQQPAWNENRAGNDLTLVQLAHPVTQQPIGIASTPGRKGRVIGWGATCEYGSPQWPCYPAGLQEADVRVVNDSRCTWYDKSVELCVVGVKGASACFGDSGGPLMGEDEVHDRKSAAKEWQLVGVVSRDGDADADTNPTCSGGTGVFTDVTKYADWVAETIHAQDAVHVQSDYALAR
jgi:secreted trypsin-like serine protease